ncbi:MAG TPA: hypothetical protein PLK99_07645 [Burkholderiales bacterium]|nr:hypothetical protein [Burkholderiales bacterium]
MVIFHSAKRMLAAGIILLAALYSMNASAQTETIDGMVVRLGLVSAEHAREAPGELQTHLRIPKSKSMQHLMVSLSYAGSGERITDAKVSIEVENPLGQIQKKDLLNAAPAGPVDYSEFFRFDMSGKYFITVFVLRKGQTEPTEAVFTEEIP